ncbi:MAG: hypothetical protein Kow0070_31770 [Anaerolineales bacterium]
MKVCYRVIAVIESETFVLELADGRRQRPISRLRKLCVKANSASNGTNKANFFEEFAKFDAKED